jgi:hypothetical protein
MFSLINTGPYSFEKILDCRLAYKEKYGPIYKEKLGPNWIVHLFDPADIAAMFREEGRLPSRGKIASLEATYLRRKKKTVGFAFLYVSPSIIIHCSRIIPYIIQSKYQPYTAQYK